MFALRRLAVLLILSTAVVGALPALTVEELEASISAAKAAETGSSRILYRHRQAPRCSL